VSSVVFQKIVIIGAGRVAHHLGKALSKRGFSIVQVFNRSEFSGQLLAKKLRCSFTSDLHAILRDADLYILAVSDAALPDLSARLSFPGKLVVHTSGTVALDVIANVSEKIGVFYPLQTFAPGRKIDFKKVPFCIESNSSGSETELFAIAKTISSHVKVVTSENRRFLHLCAVFACNFTNLLFAITEDLLHSKNLPFEMLHPLIHQTAGNILKGNLMQYQTGPAVRGDTRVLNAHRELLSAYPDYLQIYNLLTDTIIQYPTIHGKL